MMNNDVKGGLGNSYTAQFWEYDSRIGRRWNLDPRPIGGVSEYSTFNNNPILYNDPLGDTSSPSSRSAFGQKGFVNLTKFSAPDLPYEGNILNRLNAAANNWALAPASDLVLGTIDAVTNPGWTLTNMKDGIVGGFQSLGRWSANHPDPIVGISEVFNGAVSYGVKNYNNPKFHRQVATMFLGVFGGGTLGSRINLAENFTLKSASTIDGAAGAVDGGNTLFHYTSEAGYNAIMQSKELLPSIGVKNARFGAGQYLTDIAPGQLTLGQTSARLFGVPWNKTKLTHFIEIDVNGLHVVKNPKPHNYVVPGTTGLSLKGRVVNSGLSTFKPKP